MIAINDLRFGNLVTWEDEKEDFPLTVSGILSKEDLFVEWVWNDGMQDHTECGIDSIRPIVITNVFLTKNGFSEDNNGHFWLNLQTHYLELIPMPDGYYPVYAQLPEMNVESEQRVGLNKINFIHQLQNIFYSLRGVEMEVVW